MARMTPSRRKIGLIGDLGETLWPGDDLVLGAHKAQNLARDFLDEIGVGLLRRQKGYVALKLGAHGLEAFDLELQQS